MLLLTLWFLFAKKALGHFCKEFLSRTWGVELWHHHTAAGGKLIRGETLDEDSDKKGTLFIPGKSYIFQALSYLK